MKRRDLLKLGASAAAAPVGIQAQQHQHEPPQSVNRDWKPALFDDHQNQTVIVLTELIIPETDTPGAKAALVNRHLDKLLHDGSAERQEKFLAGLAWLDGYALRKYQRPFIHCARADQVAILETLATHREPSVAPGHQFFRMAKDLTTHIYYATEAGFKEMNKGGRVPATFGCQHSSHF